MHDLFLNSEGGAGDQSIVVGSRTTNMPAHETHHAAVAEQIKGCLTEASLTSFFEQRVDEYPIREIIDRLRNSRKIKLHTFKAFLGFPEIQNYVGEHLLKNNVMLK